MRFRFILIGILLSITVSIVSAQEAKPSADKQVVVATVKAEVELPRPQPAITNTTPAKELARDALAAHGGEKFRQLKSLFMTGTADLSSEQMRQVLPARFAITYKGQKTRMDVKSAMFNFTTINDGVTSYSSFKGLEMPSLNKFSTRVLARIDEPGYVVSDLPNRKKLRAFRITDPDGDSTDFYVDPVTGRVMSYEFTYLGMRSVIEHDKFRVVDGVLVPEKFAQRFETQNMGAMFAEFSIKDVQVNLEVGEDVFAIPEH
jgi:hypothetical protein